MAVTLKAIYQDMQKIKNELLFIRHIMEEDYELSDEAKQKLEIARKTPLSEYISHEDVKKMLLK